MCTCNSQRNPITMCECSAKASSPSSMFHDALESICACSRVSERGWLRWYIKHKIPHDPLSQDWKKIGETINVFLSHTSWYHIRKQFMALTMMYQQHCRPDMKMEHVMNDCLIESVKSIFSDFPIQMFCMGKPWNLLLSVLLFTFEPLWNMANSLNV